MQLSVADVMTRTPKTIGSQEMAVDAMQASGDQFCSRYAGLVSKQFEERIFS